MSTSSNSQRPPMLQTRLAGTDEVLEVADTPSVRRILADMGATVATSPSRPPAPPEPSGNVSISMETFQALVGGRGIPSGHPGASPPRQEPAPSPAPTPTPAGAAAAAAARAREARVVINSVTGGLDPLRTPASHAADVAAARTLAASLRQLAAVHPNVTITGSLKIGDTTAQLISEGGEVKVEPTKR